MECPLFQRFLGVDQTGAALAGGRRARPLPAVLLELPSSGEPGWAKQVVLPDLTRESVLPLLSSPDDPTGSRGVVLLDGVLGLPKELQKNEETGSGSPSDSQSGSGSSYLWREFFRAARMQEPDGRRYGRALGEKFFSEIWSGPSQSKPTRTCERWARANSVFQLHPFQKNIQTGTFRLWRELGQAGEPWIRIWPQDRDQVSRSGPWLFEGYPSLLWRELLGLPTRDLSQLLPHVSRVLAERQLSIRIAPDLAEALARSPGLADAWVLALGGALLQQDQALWLPHDPSSAEGRAAAYEGWIAGLRRDASSSASERPDSTERSTSVRPGAAAKASPARKTPGAASIQGASKAPRTRE